MPESLITKKALSDSLKQLTHEKLFDKISVKDITDRCGITRQTFYYHFTDKFELLEWIYTTEIFEPSMDGITFENWEEKLRSTLEVMLEDKTFYVNTINHTEDYMNRFMIQQTQNVFELAIEKLDEERKVDRVQRDFIARFFAYGVCGIINEWVSKGMLEPIDFIAANMRKLQISCENAAYIYITEEIFERNKEKYIIF